MLKIGTFALGLTTGVFLGIHLREQGFSSGFTRAFYAFQNPNYGEKNRIKRKVTFDDAFDYYRAGLLQGEDLDKFKEIIKTKRYDKIDELVLNDVDKVFEKDEYFREIKNKYIQNKDKQ